MRLAAIALALLDLALQARAQAVFAHVIVRIELFNTLLCFANWPRLEIRMHTLRLIGRRTSGPQPPQESTALL